MREPLDLRRRRKVEICALRPNSCILRYKYSEARRAGLNEMRESGIGREFETIETESETLAGPGGAGVRCQSDETRVPSRVGALERGDTK